MWPNANRNRWACPGEAKRFITRSPDSGRLMGVLGPVVEVLGAAMGHRRQKLAVSDLIAGELIGHEHARHIPQAL